MKIVRLAALLICTWCSQVLLAGIDTTQSFAPMLKTVMPSVVNIVAQGKIPWNMTVQKNSGMMPSGPEEFQQIGSGVIIDADKGYIVTNAHVIHNTEHIIVTLNDGRRFTAHTLGMDIPSDLAVLAIPPQNLKALEAADHDQVEVGDVVIAIGSPFGLSQSVTSGIVSGKHRHIGANHAENYIQTDAPINPGNSGGALINSHGKLVGINTAIFRASPNDSTNIGIGFAIPITLAKPIVAQLIEFHNVKRGHLGIIAQNLSPSLASAMQVKGTEGAIINEILPESGAEKAKLQVADIITHINDIPVASAADVKSLLGVQRVDSTAILRIKRDGKPMKIEAKLGEQKTNITANTGKGDMHAQIAGLQLASLDQISPSGKRLHAVEVLNVQHGSAAWLSGLFPRDVITHVNKKPVHTLDDLVKVLKDTKPKDALLMTVLRGEQKLFLVISQAG